tara:strand:- start:221 stop:451 length:231 start_codon:yes stop_codon:yes gene_type:complete
MRGANGTCEYPQLTHQKEYSQQYYIKNKEKIRQNRLRRAEAKKRFAIFIKKIQTETPPTRTGEPLKNIPKMFLKSI